MKGGLDTIRSNVSSGTGAKEQVSAVAIAPDGRRALAAKFAAHKVALLDIADGKVSYSKYDIATGLWPYLGGVLHGSETRGGGEGVRYVFVYSGPEPPSGGVRRPPLAVIAPHWMQFDAVTSTPPSTAS